jgi:hypothetical protein
MAIFISLHNSDLADLFLSVADLNLAGSPLVVQNLRVNEDGTVQLSIQEDGQGNGKIQWIAQRTDDASQTAERTVDVTNGATIDVTTHFG